MKTKIVISVIILTLVAGIFSFWYFQRNIYSKQDLKLDILAPPRADLAQLIEYTVLYTNNGEFRLENPVLTFQFPDHSIVEDGQSLRQEIPLETIYPGQGGRVTFKARLFGKEGDTRTAQAQLKYSPSNLDIDYVSETEGTTQITSDPLTLDFVIPSKIEAGKETTFKLGYRSDATYPLSNLGIKIEYPSGFIFKSASPQPLEETDWDIVLLNRGEGDSIEITGEIKGEVGEQKTFGAQLGLWQDGSFVILKEISKRVEIVIPSLYIAQEVNRNPQYIAEPGDFLHYEITFRNIGREPFTNLVLMVRLEGKSFDFNTVKVPDGDFHLSSRSIFFDGQKNPELQFLGPQEGGKAEFWIELGPQEKNAMLKNRVSLGAAVEEFEIKIDSKIELEQLVEYRTITWDIKNHYNNVENIKVRAVLAEDLSLTGEVVPGDSVLTFDSRSREVVWSVEKLEAGQKASISFGISERSKKPFNLIKISGEDQWTERITQTILEIEGEEDYDE